MDRGSHRSIHHCLFVSFHRVVQVNRFPIRLPSIKTGIRNWLLMYFDRFYLIIVFDANLDGLPNLVCVKIDQINSFGSLMLPETYNADIYFNGNTFQEFMWRFHCLANNNWAVEEITTYIVYIDVSVTGIGPVLAGFDILSLILAPFLMIWQSLPSYPNHLSHKIKRGHDLMDKSRRQLSTSVMLGSFYCYRRRLLLLKHLISRLSPSNHWMSFNRCMWRVPYYVLEWKPGKIER